MAYLRTKVAQVFPVYGNFSPTKASVHLRTSLHMNSDVFFHEGDDVIIDATNFSSLDQGGYKILLNDTVADYTGKGCMELSNISTGSYPILHYPVKATTAGNYSFYLRVRNPARGFNVNAYLDGEFVVTGAFPAVGAAWSWVLLTIPLEANNRQELGLQIRSPQAMIDKIDMRDIAVIPIGHGPTYSVSPYLTIHMRLFSVDNDTLPQTQYFVYDYKTTISEVVQDGWYNFNINFLHNNGIENYSDLCALVMSATGSHNRNFIFWDLSDSSEYAIEPSLYFE